MNHLEHGTIAVGAPGSIARAQAEHEDAIKELEARGIHIDPTLIHLSGIEAFRTAYTQELTKDVLGKPNEYAWPVSDVPVVVERMTNAVYHGNFFLSNALKRTAKRLGLQPSKKYLHAFMVQALKGQ